MSLRSLADVERAKALPHRRVIRLRAGLEQGTASLCLEPHVTTTPTQVSAARALNMAGCSPQDMQFAQRYD